MSLCSTSIPSEIRRKNWAFPVQPLEVIEDHRQWHRITDRSDTRDLLLVIHCNYGLVSHCFRNKRRFRSKKTLNFYIPCIYYPVDRITLGIFNAVWTHTKKTRIPVRYWRYFDAITGSDRQTDRQTDRISLSVSHLTLTLDKRPKWLILMHFVIDRPEGNCSTQSGAGGGFRVCAAADWRKSVYGRSCVCLLPALPCFQFASCNAVIREWNPGTRVPENPGKPARFQTRKPGFMC